MIEEHEGVALDPSFLFDVQVKRLHEYKRQLLNALCIMDLYLSIKDGTLTDFTPTAFIFGAKAAPGYRRAKAIIHYVNRIAELINNDPAMEGVMKVVFVQNYNCSYAEHIIPAADISEQISPAGTEASDLRPALSKASAALKRALGFSSASLTNSSAVTP